MGIIFSTCCTPIPLELQIFRFLSKILTTPHKSSQKKKSAMKVRNGFLFQFLYMSDIEKKAILLKFEILFFSSELFFHRNNLAQLTQLR